MASLWLVVGICGDLIFVFVLAWHWDLNMGLSPKVYAQPIFFFF